MADSSGIARSKDIAAVLGVARPSVTGALKLLAKRRLVRYRPYGYVTLTETGLAQAGRVAKKHDIIKSFFTDILGVDGQTAQKAACKAEHLLGPVIVSRMRYFTNLAKKRGRAGENLGNILERFAKGKGIKK